MDTRKCRGYVSTMFKTMRVERLWRRQTALLSQADWEEGDKWLFPLPTTTNESRKVVLIGTFNSETHVDHVFVCTILLLRHCITLLEHALLVTYIVNSLCLRRSVSVSIYWKSRRNACLAIRTRLSLCLLLSVPQNFPPFSPPGFWSCVLSLLQNFFSLSVVVVALCVSLSSGSHGMSGLCKVAMVHTSLNT